MYFEEIHSIEDLRLIKLSYVACWRVFGVEKVFGNVSDQCSIQTFVVFKILNAGAYDLSFSTCIILWSKNIYRATVFH